MMKMRLTTPVSLPTMIVHETDQKGVQKGVLARLVDQVVQAVALAVVQVHTKAVCKEGMVQSSGIHLHRLSSHIQFVSPLWLGLRVWR